MIRILSVVLLFLVTFQTSGARDPIHFENQIVPILSRYNCNSSGCHGKAEGQGGFKLSIFGFDPSADFNSIVKEGRGRRVNVSAPDHSLFLMKATGRVPHGGGTRLKVDTKDYRLLRDWIAGGLTLGDPNAPHVVSLRVDPASRELTAHATIALKVSAKQSDGREDDVTEYAKFYSNNEALATVSADGVVRIGDVPGEVAIMAAYRGEVSVCRILIPRGGPPVTHQLPQFNFIDTFVDQKLARLNIAPSGACDDATFIRRVYIDLIGKLPTAQAVREFLRDTSKDKRRRMIDELLNRPEFADLMALRWADLLRVNRQALGRPNAYAYYRWIRESFAKNVPFDQFAESLVTAEGPLSETPPANFFKVVKTPGDAASQLAQVFLGVRIACAQCHHHPTDRWTQTDYAGMQAFFAPLQVQGGSGSEAVVASGDPVTRHPRSGEPVFAYALGTKQPASNPTGDRRLIFAKWMTDPSNPFFARNFVNRIWANLLGRGIVEPVDDVRATNPPSHPELLDALAEYAVEHEFDTREVVRIICYSRVYQTASIPNESNLKDEQNYSRALFKRPGAEVLLDMIGQTTGIADRFAGMPAGTRAVQVWDSETRQPFLKLFGRPMRTTACDCERNAEPSTAQVLNLMNSPELQFKLSHEKGFVARLSRRESESEVIQELYLTFFSRMPTESEQKVSEQFLLSKTNRRQAIEDMAWAMMNSLEFSFNH